MVYNLKRSGVKDKTNYNKLLNLSPGKFLKRSTVSSGKFVYFIMSGIWGTMRMWVQEWGSFRKQHGTVSCTSFLKYRESNSGPDVLGNAPLLGLELLSERAKRVALVQPAFEIFPT